MNFSPSSAPRAIIRKPALITGLALCLTWVAGCKQPPPADSGEPGAGQKESGQSGQPLSTDATESNSGDAPGKIAPQESEDGFLEVDNSDVKISPEDSLAYFNGNLFSGRAKSFYENGQQATEVNYVDGMRDGLESRWFENGAKKFEARFHNNQLTGVYEEWFENGKKKTERVWQDGKAVSVKEWSSEGELVRDD